MSQASVASIESFLREETTGQLINRLCSAWLTPEMSTFNRASGYREARSLDEIERERNIRAERFKDFFCRTHKEWRVVAYVKFILEHLSALDSPELTDETILRSIADLHQTGKIGEPRSAAEVAADDAEEEKITILRDLEERKQLIDKIVSARHKNDRTTRLSDVDFENSNETYRKELATHTTEVLRQRVLNIERRRQAAGMSHEDLCAQARREGGDVQLMQYGGSSAQSEARRESPDYALPNTPEYSADTLKKMPAAAWRKLCFHDNGQPKYVRQGSPVTVLMAVNDRIRNLS